MNALIAAIEARAEHCATMSPEQARISDAYNLSDLARQPREAFRCEGEAVAILRALRHSEGDG